MAVAKPSIDARVRSVAFAEDSLVVMLRDGREIRAPLAWFPRLGKASPSERSNYRVIEGGRAINWPDLDEDIGVEPLLAR
jgi:hypothetical protein